MQDRGETGVPSLCWTCSDIVCLRSSRSSGVTCGEVLSSAVGINLRTIQARSEGKNPQRAVARWCCETAVFLKVSSNSKDNSSDGANVISISRKKKKQERILEYLRIYMLVSFTSFTGKTMEQIIMETIYRRIKMRKRNWHRFAEGKSCQTCLIALHNEMAVLVYKGKTMARLSTQTPAVSC